MDNVRSCRDIDKVAPSPRAAGYLKDQVYSIHHSSDGVVRSPPFQISNSTSFLFLPDAIAVPYPAWPVSSEPAVHGAKTSFMVRLVMYSVGSGAGGLCGEVAFLGAFGGRSSSSCTNAWIVASVGFEWISRAEETTGLGPGGLSATLWS